MTVDTHCEPTGFLGTGEVAVSNVGAYNIETLDPGAGSRRGIIVFIHGLGPAPIPNFPIPVTNSGSPPFAGRFLDFANAVVADDWVFCSVSLSEDFSWLGSQAIYNDMANDPGFGTRFLNHGVLNWWDHLIEYFNTIYGSGRPVVPFGFSMGGGKVLHLVTSYAGRSPLANVIGYIAHCPVTVMENINPAFTGLTDGFYPITCSGYDLSPTILNGVTLPGIVGYGTNDDAVGWGATTYTGSTVNVASLPTTLAIASTAKMVTNGGNNASLSVPTTAGTAILGFTGLGTGTLTGCTTLAGTGSFSSGAVITQSAIDTILTNGASAHLTRNQTADNHEFTGTPSNPGSDAATYAAWVASTLDPSYPVSF